MPSKWPPIKKPKSDRPGRRDDNMLWFSQFKYDGLYSLESILNITVKNQSPNTLFVA